MTINDDYYTHIASSYNELHGAEQERKLHAFLKQVPIPPGARILDVGCATGNSHKHLQHTIWHGIEPSIGLLELAPPSTLPHISNGNGEQLPWQEHTFDYVLSLTTLQNYHDPEQGIKELARVTKKNGYILISFIKKTPQRSHFDNIIKNTFKVQESWEEPTDIMYICKNK